MGVYERLGVRPVINGRGMNTMASGSLMRPEVLAAMAEAATAFVDMAELNARAGERIASLIGVEAACVTSGSAGGLLLAAAAVMAGDDPERVRQLPDTSGMRNEIVIQRCDRVQYDQALRMAGARLVEAGEADGCTVEQLEAAIGERTAALIYIVSPKLAEGGVRPERMAEAAHARGLPLIVDAASTLPPSSHLTYWTERGADLVIYSGGKGIRGPQCTGILVGRRDLIRAAVANAAPNPSVGRPCKVGKEEIVGLVTALELFLETDHQAEWERQFQDARLIAAALEGVPGTRVRVEDDLAVWSAPTVLVRIDPTSGRTAEGVIEALRRGEPPIMLREFRTGELLASMQGLQPGEAEVVARRLLEVLRAAG